MKRIPIFGLAALLLIGLFFTACQIDNKDNIPSFLNQNDSEVQGETAENNAAMFFADIDKAIAVEIPAVQNNTRENASGPKITSGAESDDFPGIYFIWDSKTASDNG